MEHGLKNKANVPEESLYSHLVLYIVKTQNQHYQNVIFGAIENAQIKFMAILLLAVYVCQKRGVETRPKGIK